MTKMTTDTMTDAMTDTPTRRQRLQALALFGLLNQDDDFLEQPWCDELLHIEETERARRSLERRLRDAKLGAFKPLVDFDWKWPKRIDRALFDELLTGQFIASATNAVLMGPNGTGKTMLCKGLVHQAILNGASARFVTAADMLHDLAAQESSAALTRRLKRYTGPAILAIDELGYLAYDNRYADLLFEVVTRRYQSKPIVLSTNLAFDQWGDIFPNATCVVTLIDRLVHQCEILSIEGESYRLKEANERTAESKKRRAAKNNPTTTA